MRFRLGAVAALTVAALAGRAGAAEMTRVASRGEAGNPFDLHVSLRWDRLQERAQITREVPDGATIIDGDELRYVRTVNALVPRVAVAIAEDLEIHFEWPYVLGDDREWRFGIVGSAPSGGILGARVLDREQHRRRGRPAADGLSRHERGRGPDSCAPLPRRAVDDRLPRRQGRRPQGRHRLGHLQRPEGPHEAVLARRARRHVPHRGALRPRRRPRHAVVVAEQRARQPRRVRREDLEVGPLHHPLPPPRAHRPLREGPRDPHDGVELDLLELRARDRARRSAARRRSSR